MRGRSGRMVSVVGLLRSRGSGSHRRGWRFGNAVVVLGLVAVPASGGLPAPLDVASAAAASSSAMAPTTSTRGVEPVQAASTAPAGARALGPVSTRQIVSASVVLEPRDNSALLQFISDVTDKSSPLFHHYLPAGAFGRSFGPSPTATDAVIAALEAALVRGERPLPERLAEIAADARRLADPRRQRASGKRDTDVLWGG